MVSWTSPGRLLAPVALATVAFALAFLPESSYSSPNPENFDSTARTARSVALDSVVVRYCQNCHNERLRTGDLSLDGFKVDSAATRPEVAEEIIKKLRAQMMPPPASRRPGGDSLAMLAQSIENVMDEYARKNPNPGVRTVQRLNRAEYQRAILGLLKLEVDPGRWLPPDQMSANFDNIADVQGMSPTVMNSYLNAARDISRIALGDPNATSATFTYTASEFFSQGQRDQLEGAPYGTRGGLLVTHDFPADGGYVFRLSTVLGNGSKLEDIDISIDGERVALLHYERGVQVKTDTILVRAGQHKISAAFVRRIEGPLQDLIRPHDYSQAGSGNSGAGTTSLPHIRDLTIVGPDKVVGVSESPSRKAIFSCHPTKPAQERTCAEQIVTRFGREAYRRPLEKRDITALMSFYDSGSADGKGFENGIYTVLRAVLASPHFVFRSERQPTNVKPGENFKLADVDLATRLSFFIWGLPPDAELLQLAGKGKLSDRRVLEQQTKRMLADPKSEALATRFAAQWLRLQDLDKVTPDAFWYPNFDRNLAQAMRRETEVFFDHIVREDRPVLELFTADYTFANERLARHYGFPGVLGRDFQKVMYPDDTRRGLFGHGSVLVQTSFGNRTSPVLRGKWVMEVLLGTPPPPPPANVPDLEATGETKDGKVLTTRERMEQHRAATACRSCHLYMDPIGLALDNFDLTGKWRYRENGMPLDTRGSLYDGTPVSSPAELSRALLARPIPLVRNFTENLMAYALGRRVEYYDQPAIRAITNAAAANEYRISSFVLGVVQSTPFQMKRADAVSPEPANR